MDAITIVDAYRKTVNIYFNFQAAESSAKTELQILDEYSAEYEDDNNTRVQTSNIAYDLNDDDYYRYMCFNSFVRNNTEKQHETYASLAVLMDMVEDVNISSEDKLKYIYDIGNSEYVAVKIGNTFTVKKVDAFKPLLNNKESEDTNITFKIVPASFISTYIETAWSGTEVSSDFWIQYPVAEDYDELLPGGGLNTAPEDKEEIVVIDNIQEAIETDMGESSEKGGTRLRLALYNGLQTLSRKRLGQHGETIIHSAIYPMPFVESLYEDYPDSKQEQYMTMNGGYYNPFRLDEMNRDIYSRLEDVIDTSKYINILL